MNKFFYRKQSSPFIILGMHRSGTSLLAKLIQISGIYIGQDFIRPSPIFNPLGHFEEINIQKFHESLITTKDHNIYNPPQLINFDYLKAQNIINLTFKNKKFWGWKDPRTLLVLDKWLELFPQAKLILIIRNPFEVVESIKKRSNIESNLKIDLNKGLQLWNHYNSKILPYLNKTHIFSYNEIYNNPNIVLNYMSKFLYIPKIKYDEAIQFTNKELKHHNSNFTNELWERLNGQIQLQNQKSQNRTI